MEGLASSHKFVMTFIFTIFGIIFGSSLYHGWDVEMTQNFWIFFSICLIVAKYFIKFQNGIDSNPLHYKEVSGNFANFSFNCSCNILLFAVCLYHIHAAFTRGFFFLLQAEGPPVQIEPVDLSLQARGKFNCIYQMEKHRLQRNEKKELKKNKRMRKQTQFSVSCFSFEQMNCLRITARLTVSPISITCIVGVLPIFFSQLFL